MSRVVSKEGVRADAGLWPLRAARRYISFTFTLMPSILY